MTAFAAVLLAAFGTPLFVIIAALALAGFAAGELDLTILFIEMYRLADTPVLSAIPLFAFTGFLLSHSDAARRLVRLSEELLGWLPGGLAIMALAVCALLTAFTGASGMTIVALGGLLYPALKAARYPEQFSLGLLTTSGSLGLLFPPSIPLILYAIVAETPVDQLFIAGILPGLLLVLALSIYSYTIGMRIAPARRKGFSAVRALRAVRASAWELLLPPVVVGGIYGGFIAVSEAAALSALYVFIIEVAVHREIPVRRLPAIARDTMVLVGSILILLAAALAYTNYVVDAEIPTRLLSFIQGEISSRFLFLILLNLFLLAVGCMIDMFAALVIVVPLVLPIAKAYDVHPVHLGIIFLTNLEIGYSTPPVGINLFIASARFDQSVLKLYRASLPFLAILLAALFVITYVPELSLLFVGMD